MLNFLTQTRITLVMRLSNWSWLVIYQRGYMNFKNDCGLQDNDEYHHQASIIIKRALSTEGKAKTM